MNEKDFESIVQKIADERGKDIFLEPEKLRPLLKDYVKNEFKRETTLLSAILETDCVEFINRAEDLNECKQFLVNRLEDDHSISPKKSAGMLDILIFVLRGQRLQPTVKESDDEDTGGDELDIDELDEYIKGVKTREVNKEAEAACARGVEYYQSANYAEAIKEFTEAIRLDPNYASAYSNRGGVYFTAGQYDPAIKDFTEAIRIDPNYADAYCNRGVVYFTVGKYDEAIEDCTEAIRLDPNNANTYNTRGAAYGQLYLANRSHPIGYLRLRSAIDDIEKVLRLAPNFPDAKDMLEALKEHL